MLKNFFGFLFAAFGMGFDCVTQRADFTGAFRFGNGQCGDDLFPLGLIRLPTGLGGLLGHRLRFEFGKRRVFDFSVFLADQVLFAQMPGEGLDFARADRQTERIRAFLHGGLKVSVGLGALAQNMALDFLQQIVVADVVRHSFLLIDADEVLHFEFVNNRIGCSFTLFISLVGKQIT